MPQDILNKFKGQSEQNTPDMNLALRRAAAFGTPEDIQSLVKFGAKIDSQDPKKKRTPIHNAVIQGKISNVITLIELGANLYLEDIEKQTPITLAKNEELIQLFTGKSHRVFNDSNATFQIVSQLPIRDLFSSQRVSLQWRAAIRATLINILSIASLNENDVTSFFKLPTFLQYIIAKQTYDRKVRAEMVKGLLSILPLSPVDRVQAVFPGAQSDNKNSLCSDIGIVSHFLNLTKGSNIYSIVNAVSPMYAALTFVDFIPPTQIRIDNLSLSGFPTKNLYMALREKIITPEQIIKFSSSYHYWPELLSDSGLEALRHGFITFEQAICCDNISRVISKNGMIAFHENLITMEQAILVKELDYLLSDFGLQALRENLITPAQAKNVYYMAGAGGRYGNLRYLMSENGLIALREKLITPEQAAPIQDLNVLLSSFGLQALREGLITPEQAKEIYHSGNGTRQANLKYLLTENGLKALRLGFITPERAISYDHAAIFTQDIFLQNIQAVINAGLLTVTDVQQIEDLPSLFRDNGLSALTKGVITLEQAKKYKSLQILNHPNGIKALEEGLITLDQTLLFRGYIGGHAPRSFEALLSNLGLQALREGLITVEQATKFYHSGRAGNYPQDNLDDYLKPDILLALREKITTLEELKGYNLYYSLQEQNINKRKKIIFALKNKLFSLSDFNFREKYSHGVPDKELDNLISKFQEKNQACLVVQKHWRGYWGRKEFGLVKSLYDLKKTGIINSFDKITQVETLLSNHKIQEASIELTALKKCLRN